MLGQLRFDADIRGDVDLFPMITKQEVEELSCLALEERKMSHPMVLNVHEFVNEETLIFIKNVQFVTREKLFSKHFDERRACRYFGTGHIDA